MFVWTVFTPHVLSRWPVGLKRNIAVILATGALETRVLGLEELWWRISMTMISILLSI